MVVEYFKKYSRYLDREMEYKIYGHAGKVCLVIPTQNNRFFEWEDRHMYPWLQKKEHFEKPHEGKVFVLIDIDEMAQNPPLAKAEKLLCETYNGKIYLYDSAQEVMDIQYEEITKRRESGLLQ